MENQLTRESITRLVDLLTRTKAVWFIPELLNLTKEAGNPSKAYEAVLEQTGKRRKALAARWYAVALRDFHPDLVGACLRWFRFRVGKPNTAESLKQFLFRTLAEGSDEQ